MSKTSRYFVQPGVNFLAVHAELALGHQNGFASWPRAYRMWLARRAGQSPSPR